MSTLMGHALSLISIAVAYMVGAATLLIKTPRGLPDWIYPLLPVVVWAALGFHAMINANVFAKNVSVENLEHELTKVAFPTDLRLRYAVGNRAGRTVMEPALDRCRWPLALATGLSYGGAFGIVAVVSGFCVVIGSGSHIRISVRMGVVYLVCAVVILSAWILFTVVKIDSKRIEAWNALRLRRQPKGRLQRLREWC
jgi:hypothetical protein